MPNAKTEERGESDGGEIKATLARLLRQHPLGLISDLDGTLSHLAGTPQAATVDPRCREALRVLAGRLDVVAVMSGRPAAEAMKMVGVERIIYIGNHGLERWEHGQTVPAAAVARYQPLVEVALGELRVRLARPDLVFENRGLVAAVHYRLSKEPQAVRASVLAVAREVAEGAGLSVAEGKHVVELRPPVALDKGTAVADLVSSHRLRGVLYLGDDHTDVAAFRQVRQLRGAGVCEGVAIVVRASETPTSAMRMADCDVSDVDEVVRLLEWVAREVD